MSSTVERVFVKGAYCRLRRRLAMKRSGKDWKALERTGMCLHFSLRNYNVCLVETKIFSGVF